MIAFCDVATAPNRVSACLSLYKNKLDIDRIIDTLSELAVGSATPDSARIKAIDLLDRITDETGTADEERAVDVDNITKSLLEQYTGCQTS